MKTSKMQEFTIYRPPLPSHRLESKYAADNRSVWQPSHSYKATLRDIQQQFTPAEHFRHKLATSGKQIRIIQRLELRMNRRHDAFAAAAVVVQARVRGIRDRTRFHRIKHDLQASLELRRATQAAVDAFAAKDYARCVQHCMTMAARSSDSLLMQTKAHYYLRQYQQAVACSDALRELSPSLEAAYYLQACSWCRLGDGPAAIAILDAATAHLASPSNAFLSLYGYICSQLSPPRIESAIDSFSAVLAADPGDLDALLERASCHCCLQDYSLAMRDFNRVLAFKPGHLQARLRRARLSSCLRDWAAAKADYSMLLGTALEDEGLQGLQAIAPADNNALAHS